MTPCSSSFFLAMERKLVNCEKTMVLWPSSASSARRGNRVSSLALGSSMRDLLRRPGWHAACRRRRSASRTWSLDLPRPSAVDLAEKGLAIVLLQFVVKGALGLVEFAEDRLLEFFGEIGGDL